MPKIEVLDSGHIDRRDSAFPTLVRLDDGDIICGFSVGGGPDVTGGTDWARSTDNGRTWTHEGTILAPTHDPQTSNHLRLSRTADNTILAYGLREHPNLTDDPKKHGPNEPVLCRSTDNGHTWSGSKVIPCSLGLPLEISNPIVVISDKRWLAPAATVPSFDRYGDIVVVFESTDKGRTWPQTYTVFKDSQQEIGYLEHKLIETTPGRILAVCWTQRFADGIDLDNHFSISRDGGQTWGPPRSTGIHGQTMTPVWLGDGRLLVLYNRRYGSQGVQVCLVQSTDTKWTVECEEILWDASARHERLPDADTVEELMAFQFGFPSALRLDDENFLAVHWCKEDGVFGIRWTRLRVSL